MCTPQAVQNYRTSSTVCISQQFNSACTSALGKLWHAIDKYACQVQHESLEAHDCISARHAISWPACSDKLMRQTDCVWLLQLTPTQALCFIQVPVTVAGATSANWIESGLASSLHARVDLSIDAALAMLKPRAVKKRCSIVYAKVETPSQQDHRTASTIVRPRNEVANIAPKSNWCRQHLQRRICAEVLVRQRCILTGRCAQLV